jgi:hypothetical protein
VKRYLIQVTPIERLVDDETIFPVMDLASHRWLWVARLHVQAFLQDAWMRTVIKDVTIIDTKEAHRGQEVSN